MSERITLSLILACYNEAPYLENSVNEIFKVLDMTKISYEIIFVYDCGQDNTLEVMEEVINKYSRLKRIKKVIHEKNEGRGKSVRDGIKVAEGDVVGFIDVDLDVHARYIPSMVSAIIGDGYDVATAFRYYKIHPSLFFISRHIISHTYRFISRLLLDERLKDSETGYKFFNREKIMPLVKMSQYNGWFWDTEIMTYCIYAGLKVKEIPCVFYRRIDKKTSVSIISTVLTHLKNLITFRKYIKKHKEKLFMT